MKAKPVYLNDRPVGEAATWSDVRMLVGEKGLPFEGLVDATEGPSGFFLYGGAQTIGPGSGTQTPPAAASTANSGSERAQAIARGLVNTGRAANSVVADTGMLRIESLSGGYYWISLDGRQMLRGNTHGEADELQVKFIEAMERAGR